MSLVDLLIKEIDEFPKLELKVRNNSDEVVFLKKAEISTLGHWDIPRPGMYPSAVPVSWTYDVKVPSNGVATYSISQEIKPNSVDRFEFSIGSDRSPYPFVGVFAYLISIKLVYNEDDKSVITPAVLLHIPASMELNASTQLPLSLKELEANKRTAQDLLKSIDGNTIIETGLVEAVKSWAEADLSKFKSE